MEDRDTATQEERKPYTPPVLVEYGSVEELTKGGSGAAVDFGSPNPSRSG